MSDFIPLSIPEIRGNEWKYLKECIDTSWVSSVGKFVDRFERDISSFCGAKYAVACMNGTAALQVALRIAGVEQNDEVIVPSLTFISSINVISYSGAYPVFMDSDRYYNIDVEKTVEFITDKTIFKGGCTYNIDTGRRISAIIPVHIFGNAVDMESMITLCRERNIRIVEDAAESLGTVYTGGSIKDKYTGTIGDMGCLSFNGNKIITTGGGGMIITDNEKYATRAKYLTTQAKDDELYYIHNEIGYNFRMTNLQAAVGVAQLELLPEYIKVKKKNYLHYKEAINPIDGLYIADVPDYADNNYWMYALQIDADKYGKGRDQILKYLSEKKIQARPVWHLNHLQRPYRANQTYRIEKAIEHVKNTINIPCSIGLTKEQIEYILKHLQTGIN